MINITANCAELLLDIPRIFHVGNPPSARFSNCNASGWAIPIMVKITYAFLLSDPL